MKNALTWIGVRLTQDGSTSIVNPVNSISLCSISKPGQLVPSSDIGTIAEDDAVGHELVQGEQSNRSLCLR